MARPEWSASLDCLVCCYKSTNSTFQVSFTSAQPAPARRGQNPLFAHPLDNSWLCMCLFAYPCRGEEIWLCRGCAGEDAIPRILVLRRSLAPCSLTDGVLQMGLGRHIMDAAFPRIQIRMTVTMFGFSPAISLCTISCVTWTMLFWNVVLF
jgi:hypothetical protein